MQQFSTDYYTILGVERSATARELRTAYLRLVREHTPESGSETFRLVSEAYRVLSNPEKREEYDTQEQLPEGVDLELRQIAADSRKDPHAAEEALRSLCRAHFTLTAPRFTLGVVLDRTARYDEAADVFELLLTEYPDNAIYAKWLGDTQLKAGDVDEGLANLKQAIVMDAEDYESYICLARHYFKQRDYEAALDVLDRGIQADGVVDINDMHLLVHKILVQARTGDRTGMQATADLLVSVVPANDEEARKWGTSRMRGLCRVFEEAGRDDLVRIVVETMRRLDPHGAPVQPDAPALDHRAALLRDDEVPTWIKTHVKISLLPEDDERVAAWHERISAELERKGDAMQWAWDTAMRQHPVVLGPLESAWHALAEPEPIEAVPLTRAPDATPEEEMPAAPTAPVRRSTRRRGRGRRRGRKG